jgi:PD-(D/E)XK nuclease superfamily
VSTNGHATITRDAAHNYFRPDGGGPYPSVTTIIDAAVGKSVMLAWTRRHAIEYLLANGDAAHYLSGSLEERANRLESAVTRASTTKADLGTRVHASLEQLIGWQIEGRQSHGWPAGHDPLWPEDQQRHIAQFRAFEQRHKVQWIASEVPMISEALGVGGTLDAIGMVDGVLTLVDFKTNRRTYLEHVLQLAAYSAMLRETHPEWPIEAAGILHLPGGDDQWRWQPIELTPDDLVAFVACCTTFVWLDRRKDLVG